MKCLVLFGDSVCEANTSTTTPLHSATKPNIDELVKLGSTGRLHVRTVPNVQQSVEQTTISELLQLFDVFDSEEDQHKSTSILASRFHNMKVCVLSTEKYVVDELVQYEANTQLITSTSELNASRVEQLVNDNDVVFIHVKSGDSPQQRKQAIEYLDSLVLRHRSDDLLHAILVSYGRIVSSSDNSSVTSSSHLLVKPVQSYQMKKGIVLENVRHNFPMYAVYYQNGSIRRDYNQVLTEQSCEKFAGNHSILADHFFGEIAYKLSLSDKYGA